VPIIGPAVVLPQGSADDP